MTPPDVDPAAILRRAREDPEWWAREVLGVRLWPGQVRILESIRDNRETDCKTSNGVGKSFLGAVAVLWFGSCWENSLALTTATAFRQVRSVVWREIGQLAKRARIPLGAEVLQTEIRWPHNTVAMGATAPEHDATKLQGMRGSNRTLIVVDEACGVSTAILDALTGSLTGDSVRLLLIGNPTDGTSDFAERFRSGAGNRITINAFDTPNLATFGITLEDYRKGTWRSKITSKLPAPHLTTPEWVGERWETWAGNGAREDDPRWVSRVLAQFPSETPDTLISMARIEDAQQRDIFAKEADRLELGVDVARSGDDESVVYYRRGNRVRRWAGVHGHDTMEVAGLVVRAVRELKRDPDRVIRPLVKVDVIGVGAGVVDRLRELEAAGELPASVVEVNVAESPRDREAYRILRDELWWGMRLRFEQGDIDLDPEDTQLATELNAPKWRINSRGQIEIEPKAETKRRLGRSPDNADAVVLCFAPAGQHSGQAIIPDPEDTTFVGPQWQP